MGFGVSASVPKVEVPKVPTVPAAPKAPDLAGAVAGAAAGVKSAASGAVSGAAGLAAGAKAAVGGVAGGALGAIAKGAASLAGVAGGLAEVAVSFKGASVDVAMEPHMVLDANASYEETKFEKGPIWIRVDLTPEKAGQSDEVLHLRSGAGFDEKRPVSDFKESGPRTVDVVFEDAPMDQAFSLDVIDGEGRTHAIFSGIPYGDLRKSKNRF
jgi:hypothetical protein